MPFSIIKKIEEKVHPIPLKERIAHALFRLNAQREKLDQMSSRLQQRDQEMFQRCIGAQVSKDFAHARIYANECAELRKMARVVLSSQLALEKVILRLQTVEEFGDILVQMAPIVGVVRETKGRIAGVIPEVANELDVVNNMLSDLTIEAGNVETKDLNVDLSNEEARKVLHESSIIAEQKIKEQFPELPSIEVPAETLENEQIAVTESGETVSFEDHVYEYIKSHDGDLSLSQCALDLGTSTDDVRKAVERLREQGKIVIE